MNKNSIKTLLCTGLAAVIGVFLALLRTEKLGIAPFPLFYIVAVLSVVVFAVLGFYIRSEKIVIRSASQDDILKCRFSVVRTIIYIFASCLVALAAVFSFLLSYKNTVSVILSVFMLLCALCAVIRAKTSDCSEKCGILSLFPVFFLCIYLLLFYRQNAKTAPLSIYSPETLTLLFLIVAAYFDSAVHFGIGKRYLRCAFSFTSFAFAVFELASYIIKPSALLCISRTLDASAFSDTAALPLILFSFGFSLFSLSSLPFCDAVLFEARE